MMSRKTNFKSFLDRLKKEKNSFLFKSKLFDFSCCHPRIFNTKKFTNNRSKNSTDNFQVFSWSAEDVASWIKKNGFSLYIQEFLDCQVDGDLLLQLDEKSLQNDIGMHNGVQRKRFMRLLNQLKCSTNYSSKDKVGLSDFLKSVGDEYCQYTYQMLLSGVHPDDLKQMSSKQLELQCGISNSIHRAKILYKAKGGSHLSDSAQIGNSFEVSSKSYDVFISYRRSNGSHLASLLYINLTNRGYSVFLDVQTLKNGEFVRDTLESVQQAKHFLLVLTSNAFDRCIDDENCKDWIHKEIVEALKSKCNIIPILDNFEWPTPSLIPKDMQLVYNCNGVRWVHDYQEASLGRVEEFMGKEMPINLWAKKTNGVHRR